MKKISDTKMYIIALMILLCIAIALLIRFLSQKREAEALVSPLEVYVNDPVLYSDSTYRASRWLWEFGNGEVSGKKYGEYVYRESGLYRVRLTVDGDIQKDFLVNVRTPVRFESDSLIRIVAPRSAMQGEYVVFRGIGHAREWRWAFGETRLTDSREQVAIYAYGRPGVYEVELMTEDTKYPVRHTISIHPKYQEDESDERTRMGTTYAKSCRPSWTASLSGRTIITYFPTTCAIIPT
jgi:hypothetical protein